ncbi:ABC transporter substrate-binding protein [Streptomyces bicolor]|uniref:ABC transporter substrate-binding protein n=1 Tax=Streptomyces bicolor TaxID=66874 RepID=UPI00131DC7C1
MCVVYPAHPAVRLSGCPGARAGNCGRRSSGGARSPPTRHPPRASVSTTCAPASSGTPSGSWTAESRCGGWRRASSPNSDATQWTVRIRKGVTFSDGRQLTAKDLLFSLRTLVEKRSPQAGKEPAHE